jgi:trigger factor
VVTKVVAGVEVEPPAVLVDEQLQEEFNEFTRTLAMQKMDMNTYLHLAKKEPEAVKQDLQNRARDIVKGRLVFSAIAKAEGLRVTPEELEQELKDTAARYGVDDAKMRKSLEEKGQLGAFEKGLLMEKVQQFLSDNAKPVPETEGRSEASEVGEKTEAKPEEG